MHNHITKFCLTRQHSNTAVGGAQVITQAASYLMFRSVQNSWQSC